MGLSIYLADRPRTGREADYLRLVRERASLQHGMSPGCLGKLLRLDKTHRAERHRERSRKRIDEIDRELREVLVDPGEAIGAPRIGIDRAATEWFRNGEYATRHADALRRDERRLAEYVRIWSRPFELVVADHHGEYVLALATDPEVRTSEGVHEETGLPFGCFRASWLPDDVWTSAPSEPSPSSPDATVIRTEVIVRIADALERTTVEHLRSAEPDLRAADPKQLREAAKRAEDGDLAEAADVFQGIDWLRLWARKGFAFEIG